MQLLFPWFLVGMLGSAIPVVIHLLQLRKPQRIVFTNTAIIKQVDLVTIQHRKIQQLLVLLARILFIITLTVAFAQPFIPAKDNVAVSGTDVVVDNSLSMQLPGVKSASLLSEAVDEARVFGEGTAADGRLRLLNVSAASLSKAAYNDRLDALRATARAKGIMAGPAAGGNVAYLFSDFQRNAFSENWLDKMAAEKEVVLVPLKGQQVGNVYVDSVWLDDAFVRARTNVGLHVRLRNGGEKPVGGCPVKVFLGARQVAAFRVTIEPGRAVVSLAQVQVASSELALGRVVTEDVPVTFDNVYYFTMQPAAPIRVLEIGTAPIAQQLYGNEPLFTYAFAKPQNVDYGTLRRANLVLVREVAVVDAGLRDGLRAVVSRGGSVVVVPSALKSAQASHQQLFRDLGLGAVQWETQGAAPELRDVAMPNAREPFFREVFGAQQRAVTMPRVAPVLRWARTGTDLMKLRDGESYLANFESGSGRVYVFSAPFAKEYSDFTSHALFVPVMYRMAMLSYQNEQLPAYQLAQSAVTLKLPATATAGVAASSDEAGIKLVKDSLTLVPGQRMVGQELRLDVPPGMYEAGFYQVQRQGKVLTTLAFNQDKKESELAAYSAAELRAMIGPDRPNIRVLEGGTDGKALAQLQAEQKGQPLWRYCVALALLALLAESLLVRFGSQRARLRNTAVPA